MAFWLASSEPDLFGRIIAVDGVPFLPALMNPAAAAEGGAAMGARIQAVMERGGRASFQMQTRPAWRG